jgi:hypothetical protein
MFDEGCPLKKLAGLYLAFSMYLESCFKVFDDTLKEMGKFKIEQIGYDVSGIIYSICIENKIDPSERFDVLFVVHDFKCKMNERFKFDGRYSFIFNIVPHNVKINSFGLCEKFVWPGLVTVKPFDYSQQLPNDMRSYRDRYIFRTEREAEYQSGTKILKGTPSYSFANDLYSGLFPVPSKLLNKRVRKPKIKKIVIQERQIPGMTKIVSNKKKY